MKRYGQEAIPKIRCEKGSLLEVDVSALMGDIAEKPDQWSAELSLRAGGSARTTTLAVPATDVSRPGGTPTLATVPVWQKVSTGVTGVVFVLLLLGLAIFFPQPTEFQLFVFRVALSLAAGGLGALIPGLLDVKVGKWVRATGAAAFFALVYLVNPPALIANHESPKQIEAPDSLPASP